MSLEVRDVTVRFGGHTALDAVSLDAPTGSVTGLIGPNGAGKTTLFNVITGVQRAQQGSVLLDGAALDGLAPHTRAKRGLGRTFQRLELFSSLTVRENIRVAVSARPGRQSSATVTAATDELIGRLDLGDLADVRADSLSTGTGRIVELARCLALDPKVLLLDEPASGQDDQETERFAAVLTELAAVGAAVLLVEHDMDLVMRVCDHIHVLDFGRLLASGGPDEIRADATVRAAYLGDEVPA
jgi:branched-chain amino acid transport system ATP-binding protein